jgi:hypothetical protein
MAFRSRLATVALLLPVLSIVAACGPEGRAGSDDDQADGSLGAPTATFPEDFGAILAVRELDDGRVLVADPLGGALYVVDMESGTRTQIGTEGQGPGEYRQPDAVWPLPGDSTLLIDLGNGRMTALGPGLAFGPTSPLSTGDPRSGMVVAIPQAVDADGNVYSRGMGGGMGVQLPDSGAILRITRGSFAIDTVAMYKLQERIRTTSGGPNNQSVSISQVPLSEEDAWGAAPDGSVVVARSSAYRVEWFAPDGTVTRGEPVAFEPVPIGTPEKEEWVRSQGRSGGGIGVEVSVNNGAMQTSFRRGGPGGGREIDQYSWPETKPPFYGGRIQVDPLGRAWVGRHVEAGADATYDVFDRRARHVATYRLPTSDRTIIGFGEGSVYVVAFDELDLNYLERYRLPGM